MHGGGGGTGAGSSIGSAARAGGGGDGSGGGTVLAPVAGPGPALGPDVGASIGVGAGPGASAGAATVGTGAWAGAGAGSGSRGADTSGCGAGAGVDQAQVAILDIRNVSATVVTAQVANIWAQLASVAHVAALGSASSVSCYPGSCRIMYTNVRGCTLASYTARGVLSKHSITFRLGLALQLARIVALLHAAVVPHGCMAHGDLREHTVGVAQGPGGPRA